MFPVGRGYPGYEEGGGSGSVVLFVYAVDLSGLSGSNTQRKRRAGTPNHIGGHGVRVGRGGLENLTLDGVDTVA